MYSWFKFVLYMNGYTNASGAELAGTSLVSSTPFTVVQGLLFFLLLLLLKYQEKLLKTQNGSGSNGSWFIRIGYISRKWQKEMR